jgi:hypothetical protein
MMVHRRTNRGPLYASQIVRPPQCPNLRPRPKPSTIIDAALATCESPPEIRASYSKMNTTYTIEQHGNKTIDSHFVFLQ